MLAPPAGHAARYRAQVARVSGPPTFAADAEGALERYRRVGYHLEPGVFGPDECAALRAAAAALPEARAGSAAPIMHPHRAAPIFLQALRWRGIVGMLERILGGPLVGIQSQFFFCPPGTPGFSSHQDNYYVQAPMEAFASAWTALEDVDAENGGLVVFPGTHHEPILPVEPVPQHRLSPTQNPNANARQVVLPVGYGPLALEIPAGAVVVLHGHLVHASQDNRSPTRWRHALLTTYVRRGAPFRAGHDAGRTAVSLEDESPR